MKTQTKNKKDEKIPLLNAEVEKAYNLIITRATELLKGYTHAEYRTYCLMDHTKNELNANLINELLCYFWNITLLVNKKDNRNYITVDLGREGIEIFGNTINDSLLQEIYSVTRPEREPHELGFSLKINFAPIELSSYYNSSIAQGETNYTSITTVEASGL